MDNLTEERYVFFRFCAGDIQECKKTLALLDDATNDLIRLALIKSAIISYARPFSGNQPQYREAGKWRLDASFVPLAHIETHRRAIEYRNKLIAHTDIPHRKPQLLNAGLDWAIGHDAPSYDDYFEFSAALNALSLELFNVLCAKIKNYERESL
jgi:hypothetical protein